MKFAALILLLCACVSVTALAVGWMIRSTPVVLVQKDGALLYVGCTVDSLGSPRQTFYPVRVDR